MAKFMRSPMTKLGSRANVAYCAPERGGFNGCSIDAPKHEIGAERLFEPPPAGSQSVGVLTGSVCAKCVSGDRREVDDAAAAVCLRIGQDEADIWDPLEASPYGEPRCGVVELDGVPYKAEQFREP